MQLVAGKVQTRFFAGYIRHCLYRIISTQVQYNKKYPKLRKHCRLLPAAN